MTSHQTIIRDGLVLDARDRALPGASARSRGLDDKYLSAALSAAEMIRKGCTACFDLTLEFPEPSSDGIAAVACAYQDAGMRAVVAPMIADRGA